MLRWRWFAAVFIVTWLAEAPARAETAADDSDQGSDHAATSASEELAAATGAAKKRTKGSSRRAKKRKREQGLRAENRAEVGGGYSSGHTYRQLPAAVVEAKDGFEVRYTTDQWRFSLPLRVSHWQPLGVSLAETRGQLALDATFRHSRAFRPELGVVIGGVWRPDWPDYYQPQADGALLPTDRYSYWRRGVNVGVASLIHKNHFKLAYAYDVRQYDHDPNFDPLLRPMHLTPRDAVVHRAELRWRRYIGPVTLTAAVGGEYRQYSYLFARDEGTGRTHAGPGGPLPNPLQSSVTLLPALAAQWKVAPAWTVRAETEWALGDDLYQGYYSFVEPRVRAEVAWKATARLRLAIDAIGVYRYYGPSSYVETATHLPLDYGDRRVDQGLRAGAEAAYQLAKQWALTTDVRLRVRDTNFPDYAPGVNPQARQYDIDWDYTNVRCGLGLVFLAP